jgi:hypothetical protein
MHGARLFRLGLGAGLFLWLLTACLPSVPTPPSLPHSPATSLPSVEEPALDAPAVSPDPRRPDEPLPEVLPAPPPALRPPTLAERILDGFVAEAERRRALWPQISPERLQRIDQRLNEGRVNFLLFGYGETHEPPLTERGIIGSYTIVSYDRFWRELSLISLTHDIRAPEIERALGTPWAVKIDQAYAVGGIPLMQQVFENATGLAADFTVVFPDTQLVSLIDHVYGGLSFENPRAFEVLPFYLEGDKYPRGFFPAGRITLDGKGVLQYIKTVPVERPGAQDKRLEHNVRKHRVARALLEATRTHLTNPVFLLKLLAFLKDQGVPGGS